MWLFLNIATYGGSNNFLFLWTSIFKPLQLELRWSMTWASCWGNNLSEFVAWARCLKALRICGSFWTFVVVIYNFGRLEHNSRSSGKIVGLRARFLWRISPNGIPAFVRPERAAIWWINAKLQDRLWQLCY